MPLSVGVLIVESEPLIFVGTCDLAGLVRGKGFAQTELSQRLREGVGLAPSNIMMSPFGPILDTPYGTEGDLMLVPDTSTFVEVDFEGSAAERFYLGDITNIVRPVLGLLPAPFPTPRAGRARARGGLHAWSPRSSRNSPIPGWRTGPARPIRSMPGGVRASLAST